MGNIHHFTQNRIRGPYHSRCTANRSQLSYTHDFFPRNLALATATSITCMCTRDWAMRLNDYGILVREATSYSLSSLHSP